MTILNWRVGVKNPVDAIAIGVKAVYPQQMRDPSNVFKDAVDELFQGAMVALNSSNDIVFP